MKPFSIRACLLVVFAAMAVVCSRAEDESGGVSAFDAFSASDHIEDGESILGMVGFYGQPAPPQWLILTAKSDEPGRVREVVGRNRKVVGERSLKLPAEQEVPEIPIQRQLLSVDSDEAFRAAAGVAREHDVGFESVHFHLRCRDLGQEPVWMLQLVNRSQGKVGVIYVSATSGDVLRVSWMPGFGKPDEDRERAAGEAELTAS